MNKILFIIITFICINLLYSQHLKIGLGAGYCHHISNADGDQLYPKDNVANLGNFYGQTPIFDFYISYKLDIDSKLNGILFQLHYDIHTLRTKEYSAIALGQKLSVSTLGASAGYSASLSDDIYLSFSAGVFNKIYEGHENYTDNSNNYEMKVKYDNDFAYRLSVGVDYEIHDDIPFGCGLDLNYEFGYVNRSDIEIYKDDEFMGKNIPKGDLILPDNQLSICFNVFLLLSI
ncbi:MAG: hypothetical protein V1720_09295 [bacterium]